MEEEDPGEWIQTWDDIINIGSGRISWIKIKKNGDWGIKGEKIDARKRGREKERNTKQNSAWKRRDGRTKL